MWINASCGIQFEYKCFPLHIFFELIWQTPVPGDLLFPVLPKKIGRHLSHCEWSISPPVLDPICLYPLRNFILSTNVFLSNSSSCHNQLDPSRCYFFLHAHILLSLQNKIALDHSLLSYHYMSLLFFMTKLFEKFGLSIYIYVFTYL